MKQLLFGILSRREERLEDGGAQCAAELGLDYRISVNVVICLLNILLIKWLTFADYMIYNKPRRYRFEYLFGYVLILCMAVQIVNKVASGSLLFMLNPCHLTTVDSPDSRHLPDTVSTNPPIRLQFRMFVSLRMVSSTVS